MIWLKKKKMKKPTCLQHAADIIIHYNIFDTIKTQSGVF